MFCDSNVGQCDTLSSLDNRLLQRRNSNKEFLVNSDEEIWEDRFPEKDAKKEIFEYNEPTLNLMEEVYLLGLKDREGYTSFWNDSISRGLRGCILVELCLRGRIDLEKNSARKKPLAQRKIRVKNDTPTGDALLDEALKQFKETEPLESVTNWIEYFSGETWNLLKLKHRMKNVKERIAKNLVEKGILRTEKKNYLFFDITTHPLANKDAKTVLVRKTQEALLSKWSNNPHRMEPRILALVMLARMSDVLENALEMLADDEYKIASRRINQLEDMDLELEATRSPVDFIWAVFAYFTEASSALRI